MPILSAPYVMVQGETLVGQTFTPQTGYTGVGIQMGLENKVIGCNLRGFSTGIQSLGTYTDGSGEPIISDCSIYDYSNYGIDLVGLSDAKIRSCNIANTIGTVGDWNSWVSPDPYNFGLHPTRTSGTATSGIRVGTNAGGTTISDCHFWGNNAYDVLVLGADTTLIDNEYEGGRCTMLGLYAYRTKVIGGNAWSIMSGNDCTAITFGGYHLGVRYQGNNCLIDGLQLNRNGFLENGIKIYADGAGNVIKLRLPFYWNPTNPIILTWKGGQVLPFNKTDLERIDWDYDDSQWFDNSGAHG